MPVHNEAHLYNTKHTHHVKMDHQSTTPHRCTARKGNLHRPPPRSSSGVQKFHPPEGLGKQSCPDDPQADKATTVGPAPAGCKLQPAPCTERTIASHRSARRDLFMRRDVTAGFAVRGRVGGAPMAGRRLDWLRRALRPLESSACAARGASSNGEGGKGWMTRGKLLYSGVAWTGMVQGAVIGRGGGLGRPRRAGRRCARAVEALQ